MSRRARQDQTVPRIARLVSISGLDGVGKSVHTLGLVNELRQRGIRVAPRRSRFPFLISVPLLLYARILHFSYVIMTETAPVGMHEFGRSKILSRLFPIT